MSLSPRMIRAALLVAAAAVLVARASQLREKCQTVELTVENIHEQLDALDPVPLEYSIEWLTCAVASRFDAVMVG